jgi:hypothetical protein
MLYFNQPTPIGTSVACVQVLVTAVAVGHISGTSHRDLPRNDENRRDLSHRSDHMHSAFAMVSETFAQDAAYRPTCPFCSWTLLEQVYGC